MYATDCPEDLEREGDDMRTCTSDGSSPRGMWNGTAPYCTGRNLTRVKSGCCLKGWWSEDHYLHIYCILILIAIELENNNML